MIPIPTFARLNGKMFTRASSSVRVNGIHRIVEVDTVDWNDEVPHELVDAMNDGGPPLGKARGKYACGATIGVYADAASKFEAMILALAPDAVATGDITLANFQLVIMMKEDIRLRTVVLVDCNITGRPTRTIGNDGTAIVKQYTLQPRLVLEDGRALVTTVPAL